MFPRVIDFHYITSHHPDENYIFKTSSVLLNLICLKPKETSHPIAAHINNCVGVADFLRFCVKYLLQHRSYMQILVECYTCKY